MSEKPDDACGQFVYYFVRTIKVIAVLALLASLASYVVNIDYALKADGLSHVDKGFAVLSNSGFMLFSIMLILFELELKAVLFRVSIMRQWAPRGVWILWLGVQTVSVSKQLAASIDSEKTNDRNIDLDSDFLRTFGTVVGSILMGCGVFFIGFSLACIKGLTQAADPKAELEEKMLSAGGAMEDAVLAANLSLALGMTPAEAKKRFASKTKGAQEAQKFARERAAQLERSGAQASRAAASTASTAYSAAPTATSAYSAAPPPSQSGGYAGPSNNGTGDLDDDGGGRGRRGGGDDEDELMKAYYGQ